MTDKSLEDLWGRLCEAEECKSLLKKHLTPDLYEQLKDVKTNCNGGLKECISSGCLHLKSHTGIYASDPDAYTVFAELFDPILKEYHKVSSLEHPAPDFGDLDDLGFDDLDPDNEYINSTRIRVGRTHAKFGFPPTCSKEDRIEMERIAMEALGTLDGELAGTYHPLDGMSPEMQQQMTEDHFLFRDDDPVLGDAHGYDDWPVGRGIFFSDTKRFLVWVNEEDHLRIISMQEGGNLAEVWKRLVKGIQTLEEKLTFAHDPKFGYLTFCPTNLGTTLRASVHIRIPHFSQHILFKKICEDLHLQPRGVHGEHSDSVGGVYDISNKRRLGLSEIEAVQEMRHGIEKIISLEAKLRNGEDIEETLPLETEVAAFEDLPAVSEERRESLARVPEESVAIAPTMAITGFTDIGMVLGQEEATKKSSGHTFEDKCEPSGSKDDKPPGKTKWSKFCVVL